MPLDCIHRYQLLMLLLAHSCDLLVDAQNTSTTPVIVPGDASWIGDYGSGDGTPPIEDYLPFTYSIYGDGGSVISRVLVLPNQSCPELVVVKNETTSTTTNDAEEEFPQVTIYATGNDELPKAFAIRVCQVVLSTDAYKQAWSNGDIHFAGTDPADNVGIALNPKRYLLMGDTGLRVKPDNLGLGNCKADKDFLYEIPQCPFNFSENDINETEVAGDFQALADWQLRDLQTFAAEQNPDVVVYVGDYLYRQGPCPGGSGVDCVVINGPPNYDDADVSPDEVINFLPGNWGDTLHGWWSDFMWPSRALLKAAPLVAIRGNHESCNRAGHGYFFFFGISPDYDPTGEKCVEYSEPFTVPFPNEQFLVMDVAAIEPKNGGIDHMNFIKGACPKPPTDPNDVYVPNRQNRFEDEAQSPAKIMEQLKIYTEQFEILANKSQTHATNFFANHRPIFGFGCNETRLGTLDWTLQQSLAPNTFDRVSGVISGHMHWLEVLAFVNETLPAQVVVGHGGTKLIPNYVNQDVMPFIKLEVGKNLSYQGRVRKGITSSDMFGFSIMERNEVGDYDLSFYGINNTSGQLEKVDFSLTIPRGPRRGTASSPTPPSEPTPSSPSQSPGEIDNDTSGTGRPGMAIYVLASALSIVAVSLMDS